jgi:hypothetical protein
MGKELFRVKAIQKGPGLEQEQEPSNLPVS